jgi:hypothetical protein
MRPVPLNSQNVFFKVTIPIISVFPALLNRLPNSLGILFAVVLVEVGRFDVCGGSGVRVVEQTGAGKPLVRVKECQRPQPNQPLNARKDRCHIVRRAPTVLQNVEAELSGRVDIRVKHLADELDRRRFVRVLLFEMHHQPKCTIFKRGVRRADDDRIPDVVGLAGAGGGAGGCSLTRS